VTEAILFWILAAVSVGCGLGVITVRNPVHSAMFLVGSLFSLAGLFVLLRAHLVAALQVLVYAGAIMMLFVFVIMLLSLTEEEREEAHRTGYKLFGVLSVGVICLAAAWAATQEPMPDRERAVGTVRAVAMQLYTEYVLAFEVVAVLLLVAIIGAAVVAMRRI
jgi:NADH-quinone oxidoreductase subunit J